MQLNTLHPPHDKQERESSVLWASQQLEETDLREGRGETRPPGRMVAGLLGKGLYTEKDSDMGVEWDGSLFPQMSLSTSDSPGVAKLNTQGDKRRNRACEIITENPTTTNNSVKPLRLRVPGFTSNLENGRLWNMLKSMCHRAQGPRFKLPVLPQGESFMSVEAV